MALICTECSELIICRNIIIIAILSFPYDSAIKAVSGRRMEANGFGFGELPYLWFSHDDLRQKEGKFEGKGMEVRGGPVL